MKTILKNGTRVIIANARLSYANIFEPRKGLNGDEEKYSVSILIDKSDTDTVEKINAAIANATEDGKTRRWSGKVPKNLKTPLRDGDEERDDEAYAGCYFINANSKMKPEVVGKERDAATGKPIRLGQEDVYSGCYANVSVNFYPYSVSGNSGIACGLGNIQKERDGERLSGGASASEDFDFTDADDDFLG